MIDRLSSVSPPQSGEETHFSASLARKVLSMVPASRTAGSIAVWKPAAASGHRIEDGLQRVRDGRPSFSSSAEEDNSFGFADLLDMVNPLQHIPIINHIYRQITGDTIKPIASIIGGAVFGGPAGAAGGLINVIVEKETGRDVTGHAVAFLTKGELPHVKPRADDLPGTLLAYVDLGHKDGMHIERTASLTPDLPVWERG